MARLPSKDPFLRVANAIRQHASASRIDVARVLEMSPATTGRIVEQLIELQAVREDGFTQTHRAGRPSMTLKFNGDFGAVLTIDLRLTTAHAVITNMVGHVLSRNKHKLPANNTAGSIDQLVSLIGSVLDAYTAPPPIKVIVVGAPSTVNVDAGIVEWAQSLGWRDVPLKQILRDEFDMPVLIENDVNFAALGEYWKGAGQGTTDNMVFVSVGTGIGAGIIRDGELYRGATYAAGEVAYFVTDINALRHGTSEVGNLERRIGQEGLMQLAQQTASKHPNSRLAALIDQQQQFRPADVFDLALSEDRAAQVVFNEVVDNLTIVVADLSVVLDPGLIVLSGPGRWKWPIVIEAIRERLGSSLLRPVNLQPSQVGDDVLILGGTFAALSCEGVLSR